MSDPTKAVFLSYASQDAEAAKRICDALRAAGVEVWFDQSELVGGDAWDVKIRGQITRCALFMPVISANTQARREGYFRIEWRLAAQRTHAMSDDTAFLLPVVIDDTRDADAKVPAEFKAVQWTRLPGGETSPAFVTRVKKLLEGETEDGGQKTEHRTRNQEPRANNRRLGRLWWALPILGVTMALLLVMKEGRKDPAPPPTVAKAASVAPVSDARKLVAQARQIYEGGDELNRENLFFAEDLVKRALTLDPSDPEAWELSASLSYTMVWHLIDNSEQRHTTLLSQSARALALAPQSVPAQLAVINARLAMNFNSLAVGAADLEQELLALAAREPRNWQVQSALGSTYRFLNRPEESILALQRAVELSGGHPRAVADLVNVLWRRKRYAEADVAIAAALPGHPTGRLLTFDAITKLRWRGNAAAARQSLEAWPAWLLQEDRGMFVAWQTWMWSRDPQRALRAAQGTQRDYVRDANFYGPREVLTAQSHELAGNTEAARADWQTVLTRVERELAAEPENDAALYWKAWALARLGQTAEAQPIARRLQQRNQSSLSVFFKGTYLAPLLVTVGQPDAAFAEIKARIGVFDDSLGITRARLELDPAFDPLRTDLRFRELLESAPAPKDTAASAAKVDEKSVAVLAFANLSDDKANEYFSDGISEELLNVLAKIPDLKVAARTSAFYFKGKEVPVPEIAKQLGVAYVVEGSVRKQGDKVRITAQLIKAADGFHVWSDTFTRDLKDIFAVQDEIAGLIAKNLSLKMGMTAARLTIDIEAYQEYLAGRALFAKASNDDLRAAVGHFEKALAIEPKFTAAWVQLASTHTRLGRWGGTPTLQAWAAARAAIAHAVALEPDSPDVLLALGWILRTADWDWRGAERAFRRTLQLQPNQPEALAGAAVLLFNIGKTEEAYRLAQQAVQLDPLNASTQIDLSIMFYLNKNWAEAERAARRALALAPGGSSYRSILAWGLIGQRRYAEAEAEIAQDRDGIDRTNALGLLAIARGQEKAARDQLTQLEGDSRVDGDLADLQQSIARICAGLGEKDRAFAALDKAAASRDPSMAWLLNSWYLEPLYSDARWPVLVRKLGLTADQLK